MPLTLTIRNAQRLDNGSPLALVLEQRGAVIGRAATTDWCLPDPTLHISSRHCEIRFANGRYELIDNSTNGTFLYGQAARLAGPHAINQGDVFVVGPFEVAASLDDASAAAAAQTNAAPVQAEWKGWNALSGDSASTSAPPAAASSWDAKPVGSAISGSGPMSQNWAPPNAAAAPASNWGAPPPPAAAPEAPPVQSAWAASPPPPSTPASDWSSPAAPPSPPSGDDIWGKFAESNVVDWARGGFGSAAAPPPAPIMAANPDPLGLGSAPPPAPVQSPPGGFGTSPAPAPTAAPTPAAPPPPAAAPSGGGLTALIASTGIDPTKLKQGEAETLGQAGDLLRRLISGMVVMLEARARAKSQMGAQGTNLEFDGNNPLKFARTPEQAIAQLLNPAERGFMSSDKAIEDAFKDLQAHQMATLKAMQGALRATLDRFSPTAIKARAENKGMLAKILPTARDAALWAAYEKEFGGVAHGSDEAFMDMFAKEFRRAYEEMAAKR